MTRKKRYLGRVEILPRVDGKQTFHHIGRFDSKRERDAAVAIARENRSWEAPTADETTCDVWADRFLHRMESGALRARGGREYKDSTIDTLRTQLKAFRREFGDRTPASITRVEAEDWAASSSPSMVPAVVQLMNDLYRAEVIGRNRFLGLSQRRHRKDRRPPAEDQMLGLTTACDVLGDYGPVMRALFTFAAYTLMRPCELVALEWDNVDFAEGRILIDARFYRGKVDVPKSNHARVVALTAPALGALEELRRVKGYPTGGLVFRNKSGNRLTASTLCAYWKEVRARAGVPFEFYVATKHYGVWFMKVRLKLDNATIAAQAGWSEKAVEKMIATYAHAVDERRLAEIDAAFAALVVGSESAPVTGSDQARDTDCDTETPDRQ
jgi:integrase